MLRRARSFRHHSIARCCTHQTTDLTAMHAAEIAELRAHLASARASEEGLKQQVRRSRRVFLVE